MSPFPNAKEGRPRAEEEYIKKKTGGGMKGLRVLAACAADLRAKCRVLVHQSLSSLLFNFYRAPHFPVGMTSRMCNNKNDDTDHRGHNSRAEAEHLGAPSALVVLGRLNRDTFFFFF